MSELTCVGVGLFGFGAGILMILGFFFLLIRLGEKENSKRKDAPYNKEHMREQGKLMGIGGRR